MFIKMTRPLQQALSDQTLNALETFAATHGISREELCYWLTSFLWGFARRQGWSTRHLANYAIATFEACEKLAQQGQRVENGGRS